MPKVGLSRPYVARYHENGAGQVSYTDGVRAGRVVHGDKLILRKVRFQLGRQRFKKRHGVGRGRAQVDDRRNKILFLARYAHTFNTSSRSYTVLILPDSTLTSLGLSFSTRTTVGRESSISLAFKIGFMLKRLPL